MKKRVLTMTVLALESGAEYIIIPQMLPSGAGQKFEKPDGKGGERQRHGLGPFLHRGRNPQR